MPAYTLKRMKENLYFARLHQYPNQADCHHFLQEMKKMVADTPPGEKVYLVTDFRGGMFTDVRMLKESAKLTTHPQFGASIGFGGEGLKEIFGDIFAENAQQPDEIPPEMPKTAAEAIALLEAVAPGITAEVDWQGFFA